MHAPYLFASRSDGFSFSYQTPCPTGCGPWVEANLDAGGRARTISFVDPSVTQYASYRFSIAHPFSGFGPNVVGTATITHADGRSYAVPFDIPPGPGFGSGIPYLEVALGDSQGLPRPPRSPSPREDPCTVDDLKRFHSFYALLKASVREFAFRWGTGAPLLFNNIYACAQGKITGRVMRLGRGRPVLIAKGAQVLDYRGPGRSATKVKLTRRGRQLRAQGTTFRGQATIRVFDSHGASVTYSRTTTLRDGRLAPQPPR